ncbi:similar to mKIAA0674 protein (predicted), isoform CRA_b [Rattus norvegicus]|uniref:Similar to mKIAA0674 protein (Predicted), isoform CRA_b n=1 Tax=Rattus norvegicus TaxID=10116 RepID=A6J7T9_RAT|nr:similar to mKIAA0674 protein (predicted), isoform CRA_b [Rattus norvegicus]
MAMELSLDPVSLVEISQHQNQHQLPQAHPQCCLPLQCMRTDA